MTSYKKTALAAATLLVCSYSAHAGQALTSANLRHMVPGSYQVTLMGTVNMTVNMRANGTLLGSTKTEHDSGRWSLVGDKLCIAWNKWLGGQARCSGLTSQGRYYQGNGFTFSRL